MAVGGTRRDPDVRLSAPFVHTDIYFAAPKDNAEDSLESSLSQVWLYIKPDIGSLKAQPLPKLHLRLLQSPQHFWGDADVCSKQEANFLLCEPVVLRP